MRPGDLLLVRTDHFVSKLIRFGQRKYGPEHARWNHVAVYVGNGRIVEALTSGIALSPITKYPRADVQAIGVVPKGIFTAEHRTVVTVEGAMRENACNFAHACVGEKYGFMAIAAIAVKTLTLGRLDFGLSGTHICSGLAARSLERLGYVWEPYDPEELTPAYLSKRLGPYAR